MLKGTGGGIAQSAGNCIPLIFGYHLEENNRGIGIDVLQIVLFERGCSDKCPCFYFTAVVDDVSTFFHNEKGEGFRGMNAVQVFPLLEPDFAACGVDISDSGRCRIGFIHARWACYNHWVDERLAEVKPGPVMVNLDLPEFKVEFDCAGGAD